MHAAAASLGYRPNAAARALRTDKSRSIASVSDYVTTTRFAAAGPGALAAADAAGHVHADARNGGEPAREVQAVQAALDRQGDGIIFAAMRAREVFVPEISIPAPVVMLNGTSARFATSVLPDEYAGGQLAVQLLVDAGLHDGVVLLGHNAEEERGLFRSEQIARRLAGIRDAMARHGLSFTAELSCWNWEPRMATSWSRGCCNPSGRGPALPQRSAGLRPYQAIGEAGLSIPETSTVSFDNDELASYLRPGLTTIGLPHEEMGREAVRLLLGETRPRRKRCCPCRSWFAARSRRRAP